MANDVTIPASGTGDATPKVATEQVATTLEHKQIVELGVPGTGRTLIPGDVTNGLDVDVTRVTGVVHVDDNAGSLTVDGTVTVANPTANPETGLAKDATLTGGTMKSKLVDTAGTNVASVSAAGRLAVDASGVTVPISAVSLPLPTGAATQTGLTDGSQVAQTRAAILAATNTAATGVACTLTIPAVASQFHYITLIEIQLYATAARTGGATPILVTTTNLPGSPVWDFDTAQAIGVTIRQSSNFMSPLRSSVVGTATTIVAPIATTGIWRITAYYYAAV